MKQDFSKWKLEIYLLHDLFFSNIPAFCIILMYIFNILKGNVMILTTAVQKLMRSALRWKAHTAFVFIANDWLRDLHVLTTLHFNELLFREL